MKGISFTYCIVRSVLGQPRAIEKALTYKYRQPHVYIWNNVVYHDASLLNLPLQPCSMCSLNGISAIELSLTK